MSVLSSETTTLIQTGYATRPSVNLLPPEIEEARRFRRIQYGLSGGVAMTAAAVALLYVAAAGSVGDADAELAAATAQNTQLQTTAAEYSDVTAVYVRAAAAEAMLTEAMGQEVLYSEFLSGLSLSVPDNVWLRTLSFTQAVTPPALGSTEPGVGQLTVSGVGFSHEDVAVWLESLAGQPGYTDPSFSSSTESLIGERTVVDFSSTATLTSEALSRDYTAPAGG